jgi:hypothetical protein
MEEPRVDESGEAIWRPNGARQRFAEWSIEQLGIERIFVAIGFLIRHREYGHLPEDEGITLTKEEVADYVQWLNLKELRLIHKMAEQIEECGMEH